MPDSKSHDSDQTKAQNAMYSRDIDVAREVLTIEADALSALSASIDGAFSQALDLLMAVSGRIIVSGLGKSGHVARKIAATLASTGSPAPSTARRRSTSAAPT